MKDKIVTFIVKHLTIFLVGTTALVKACMITTGILLVAAALSKLPKNILLSGVIVVVLLLSYIVGLIIDKHDNF